MGGMIGNQLKVCNKLKVQIQLMKITNIKKRHVEIDTYAKKQIDYKKIISHEQQVPRINKYNKENKYIYRRGNYKL